MLGVGVNGGSAMVSHDGVDGGVAVDVPSLMLGLSDWGLYFFQNVPFSSRWFLL